MTVTMFDRIREEGRQKGREEGRAEQLRRNTLTLLERRFGTVSETARKQLSTLSLDQLETLFDAAISVGSLEDLGLGDTP